MAVREIARYADLAGKTVLISGGASGIGEDIVRAFHLQDAKVYFIDVNQTAADALSKELLDKTGTAPAFIQCDVTDTKALKAAIDQVATPDGLDVLINNAANDTRQNSLEMDEDAWTKAVDVNLKHQFFASTAAFAHMKEKSRGSILNFGSIAPRVGIENLAVYSTCKSAVQGLTRTLAREFGHHGVRVNNIIPGAIMTVRQRTLWISDEDEKQNQDAQCLHRTLVGDDIAQMALFLASDVSWGCTSQSFIVDGGMTG